MVSLLSQLPTHYCSVLSCEITLDFTQDRVISRLHHLNQNTSLHMERFLSSYSPYRFKVPIVNPVLSGANSCSSEKTNLIYEQTNLMSHGERWTNHEKHAYAFAMDSLNRV